MIENYVFLQKILRNIYGHSSRSEKENNLHFGHWVPRCDTTSVEEEWQSRYSGRNPQFSAPSRRASYPPNPKKRDYLSISCFGYSITIHKNAENNQQRTCVVQANHPTFSGTDRSAIMIGAPPRAKTCCRAFKDFWKLHLNRRYHLLIMKKNEVPMYIPYIRNRYK